MNDRYEIPPVPPAGDPALPASRAARARATDLYYEAAQLLEESGGQDRGLKLIESLMKNGYPLPMDHFERLNALAHAEGGLPGKLLDLLLRRGSGLQLEQYIGMARGPAVSATDAERLAIDRDLYPLVYRILSFRFQTSAVHRRLATNREAMRVPGVQEALASSTDPVVLDGLIAGARRQEGLVPMLERLAQVVPQHVVHLMKHAAGAPELDLRGRQRIFSRLAGANPIWLLRFAGAIPEEWLRPELLFVIEDAAFNAMRLLTAETAVDTLHGLLDIIGFAGVQAAAAQWLNTRGAEGDAREVVTFLRTVEPDLLTAVQPSNIGFRRVQAVAGNGDLADALEHIPCLLNTPEGLEACLEMAFPSLALEALLRLPAVERQAAFEEYVSWAGLSALVVYQLAEEVNAPLPDGALACLLQSPDSTVRAEARRIADQRRGGPAGRRD